MTDKASEGLIPVEAPPYPGHSPVSPLPPASETIQPAPPSETTNTYPSTGSEKPQIQPDHAAPVPIYPEEPAKAYQGQPQAGFAGQYPVNSPADAKAYPGQPGPEQFQQPHMYYTPYGHPSGYATATPLHSVQSAPCPVDCPSCGQREMTRVEPVTGMTTHGWAAVLCFCCCLGCIPYLMSSLKDVDHYCGKCGVKLACWHNSGRVHVLQPGQVQPGQVQPGQVQPGQVQYGQGQPGQVQPGQVQPGQVQPGQGQPGQRQ